MVEQGVAKTRARAQAMIMAGKVSVDGKTMIKSGTLVPFDAVVDVAEPPPFIGRGGLKLDSVLDRFALDVSGYAVADIGSSTGGFTDCLLKRGASHIYAVDVGYGQLDYRLRIDPRVTVMERVNARYSFSLPEKVDMATFDLSFISVEKVIPVVAGLLRDNGIMLVLLKPQFEARKREVGKGGVVRQSEVHARVIGRFIKWVACKGFRLKGLASSPILGASGNREFFIMLSEG